ncbi:MAG: S8 family serine peptidase [Eubacterium sp.]|nr:S8 family serine peptidase [Eubacterium sp.]
MNNTLLLYTSEGTPKEQIEKIAADWQAEISGYIAAIDLYQLRFSENLSEEELERRADILEQNDCVEAVYIDYAVITENDAEYYPNDPWTGHVDDISTIPDYEDPVVWDCANPAGQNWGLEAIHAPQAWEYLSYMQPVSLGLMEKDVDAGHEDLDIIYEHVAEAPEDYDSIKAWLVTQGLKVTHETNRLDKSKRDHGTHVAGIMAARSDNGTGICGTDIIPGTQIHMAPIHKVSSGIERISQITHLIGDCGCKVINFSQGDGLYVNFKGSLPEDREDQAVKTLKKLLSKGHEFLIVCAAGNKGESVKKEKADALNNSIFNHISDEEIKSRIIVVGNARNMGNGSYCIANKSSRGDRVDIMAPGSQILSCTPDNTYGFMGGTSQAAPFVSGTAAMIFGCDPGLTGAQVKEILISTADYSQPFEGVNAGMLQADAAVEKVLGIEGQKSPLHEKTLMEYIQMPISQIRNQGWDSVQMEHREEGWTEQYMCGGVRYDAVFSYETAGEPGNINTNVTPISVSVTASNVQAAWTSGAKVTEEIRLGMEISDVTLLSGDLDHLIASEPLTNAVNYTVDAGAGYTYVYHVQSNPGTYPILIGADLYFNGTEHMPSPVIPSVAELYEMSLAEIDALSWDGYEDLSDTMTPADGTEIIRYYEQRDTGEEEPGNSGASCFYNIVFYYFSPEQTAQSIFPLHVTVYDGGSGDSWLHTGGGTGHLPVTDTISTGMTYSEVAGQLTNPEASEVSYDGSYAVYATLPESGRTIMLAFRGSTTEYADPDAVLVSAQIS